MAVAHDGEANATNNSPTAVPSLTVTGKTTAGSDRYGVCAVIANNGASVTGVTWNGSAMTQLASVINGTDGRGAYLYGIAAPPTAASDVVVSMSPDSRCIALVSSYNGAHQTTQNATPATASGTASPATVNVTDANSGDMVVDSLYFIGAGTPPAVGAGQTGDTADDQNIFGGHSREAGPATVTMSWTLTSATRWSIAAIAIRAAAAGAPTITDVGDELFYHGETGVVITGTGFGATQGGATVTICATDSFGDASATTQEITSWSDTSVTIKVNRGTLSLGATLYLFVENADLQHNAAGYPVSLRGNAPALCGTMSGGMSELN